MLVVPSEVLSLVTPLLCNMETEGLCLRLHEFVPAINSLYETMTIPEKKIILNFGRNIQRKDAGEDIARFNFKVSINQ